MLLTPLQLQFFDVAIVTRKDSFIKVVDKNNIRRVRPQLRKSFQVHCRDCAILEQNLDDRKDNTMENVGCLKKTA